MESGSDQRSFEDMIFIYLDAISCGQECIPHFALTGFDILLEIYRNRLPHWKESSYDPWIYLLNSCYDVFEYRSGSRWCDLGMNRKVFIVVARVIWLGIAKVWWEFTWLVYKTRRRAAKEDWEASLQ